MSTPKHPSAYFNSLLPHNVTAYPHLRRLSPSRTLFWCFDDSRQRNEHFSGQSHIDCHYYRCSRTDTPNLNRSLTTQSAIPIRHKTVLTFCSSAEHPGPSERCTGQGLTRVRLGRTMACHCINLQAACTGTWLRKDLKPIFRSRMAR